VSPLKVILATMVIFTCGIFTGVFVIRLAPGSAAVSPAPQPVSMSTNRMKLPPFAQLQPQRPEFLKRLDRQLDLTPEQHDNIAKIMKASQDRTVPLWENIAPQMQEELKRVRKEISQALTPEQRKKWAEINKRARASAPGNQPDSPAQAPATETNAP
jgi:Spy/CpxP family protein refolding chaperone